MNTFSRILLILILPFLAIFTNNADSKEVSFLFGGWSNHNMIDKDGFEYNENHNLIGIEFDQVIYAKFKNSYNDSSTVLAYSFNLTQVTSEYVDLKLNLAVGLVSGYQDYNIISGVSISPYFSTIIETTFKIRKDLSFSVDTGLLPDQNGVIVTHSLKITYNF